MDDFADWNISGADGIADATTSVADFSALEDQTNLGGNGSSLPLLSDTGFQMPTTVLQKTGSGMGSTNILDTIKNLGTTVGTIQKDINAAPGIFKTAQNNAASGNSLGQWWQYASTTDKLVVGLAVATLIYMIGSDKGAL